MIPRNSVRGTNSVQIEPSDLIRIDDLDNFIAVRAVLASPIGLRHLQAERALDLDRFSPLSNEIYERANRCGSNVQPLQNFLVFGENILRVQPQKVFLVRPAME